MSDWFVGLASDRVDQVQVSRLPQRPASERPKRPPKNLFVKGPIPLRWLTPACRLGGQKVLATGLALWFLAGLYGTRERLKLTSATLERFEVDTRSAKYRSLETLEQAGLIRVERERGKNPRVTIVVPAQAENAA